MASFVLNSHLSQVPLSPPPLPSPQTAVFAPARPGVFSLLLLALLSPVVHVALSRDSCPSSLSVSAFLCFLFTEAQDLLRGPVGRGETEAEGRGTPHPLKVQRAPEWMLYPR